MRKVLDLTTILEAEQYYRGEARQEGPIRGIAWSADGSGIGFEVGGCRLQVDTLYPMGGVYTVDARVTGLPSLLAVQEFNENYYTWPAILMRGRPRVSLGPSYRPLLNYVQSAESWAGDEPTRLIRYTEPIGLNPQPEVEGWVLAAVPWDGSDESVLVRIADGRLVAANPPQTNAADDAAQCANDTVVPNAGRNPGLVQDCRVLLGVRDTLAGNSVLHWHADSPITQWPGVMVDGGRVSGIVSVPGIQLSGTLPPDLNNLSQLEVLNLEDNELHGSLPPELGRLANLRMLSLGGNDNHLTGAIPAELGELENIEELYIDWTGVLGEIPPELGAISGLRELHLRGNSQLAEPPVSLPI